MEKGMTDTLPQPQRSLDVIELIERYEDQHDIFGDISSAYEAVVEEVYDLAGMSQNQLASLHHQFSVDERYSRCIAMVVVIDMEKAGFGMPSPDNTATGIL